MIKGMHSKEKAPTKDEFLKMIKIAEKTGHPLQNKFLLYSMGRLTMRIGTVLHIKKEWVDFKQKLITIPSHDPCCCQYCIDRYKIRHKKKNVTKEEVLKEQWQPKTKSGNRTIPYDIDAGIEQTIEDFFKKYSKSPLSSTSAIRERIKKISKIAGIDTHPHALRSASATYFAYDNVPAAAIKYLMGWNDITMANDYIADSGVLTTKTIRQIYKKDETRFKENKKGRIVFLTNNGLSLIRKKRDIKNEDFIKKLFSERKNVQITLNEL